MTIGEIKKINNHLGKVSINGFEIPGIVEMGEEPKLDAVKIFKIKEYHRSRRLKKKSYYNESVESLFR